LAEKIWLAITYGEVEMRMTRLNDRQESLKHRISFSLVEDIRAKFNIKYPDVNDPPENEHPKTAVGIVLLSAIILETTDIGKLVRFTSYSPAFISAISANMRHNTLWENGRYKEEHWLPWFAPDWTINDDDQFWIQIEIACGDMWQPCIDTQFALDPCRLYWDERPLQRHWSSGSALVQ
jgi:hypothetical protein